MSSVLGELVPLLNYPVECLDTHRSPFASTPGICIPEQCMLRVEPLYGSTCTLGLGRRSAIRLPKSRLEAAMLVLTLRYQQFGVTGASCPASKGALSVSWYVSRDAGTRNCKLQSRISRQELAHS